MSNQSTEQCGHGATVANLVDRFERWKGYQCPYCEIERQRALLRRIHSMLSARDPVVFSQELGFIEAELQGQNGSVGVTR